MQRIFRKFLLFSKNKSLSFFQMKPTKRTTLLNILFQILYMFRATMFPSSGKLTVSMRHWYFVLCMGGCLVCCSRPAVILKISQNLITSYRGVCTWTGTVRDKTCVLMSLHHICREIVTSSHFYICCTRSVTSL